MRQANFHLGLFVCALAVLLALPILDFGAISTRNQTARLESGEVKPDDFDFAALRWDFGEPGRRALKQLGKSGNARVAELARTALAQESRGYSFEGEKIRTDEDFALLVQPEDPALRQLALDYLKANPWRCQERCAALDLGTVQGGRRVAIVEQGSYEVVRLAPGKPGTQEEVAVAEYAPDGPLTDKSKIEIREVPTRFIFVDGKPLGPPLKEPTTPLEASPPRR